MSTETIHQPDLDAQRRLDTIIQDGKTQVRIKGTNRSYRIGWLRNGTLRTFTHIMLREKDERKVTSKCAAVIVLNSFWKIRLLYAFLWRWFYYVREYSDEQLMPLIEEGKKKIPVQAYLLSTILLTGMKDTMMTMTRAEAERALRALRGAPQEP